MRMLTVVLAALLVACGSGRTAREDATTTSLRKGNEPGVAIALCGDVARYTAATEATDGVLAIDRRTWPIAAGTRIADDDILVANAKACIDAEIDASKRIVRCVVSTPLDPGWPE